MLSFQIFKPSNKNPIDVFLSHSQPITGKEPPDNVLVVIVTC